MNMTHTQKGQASKIKEAKELSVMGHSLPMMSNYIVLKAQWHEIFATQSHIFRGLTRVECLPSISF